MDDVVQRANISRRPLFRYFGTRKAVIQAVINAENGCLFRGDAA
ncbi:TetR family transcriptional regulator [Pandoraea terrae]